MRAAIKVVLIIFLLLISWIGYLAFSLTHLNPQITAEWGYVDENRTEIWLHVNLGRGIPLSLSIDDATLALGVVPFGEIRHAELGFMQKTIDLPLVIDNKNAVQAFKVHIGNGESSKITVVMDASIFGVPFRREFNRDIETDILGELDSTLESIQTGSEENALLQTPQIERVSSRWGEIVGAITIYSDVTLYNPNIFPIPVRGIEYEIYMNDYNVAHGELLGETTLPSKGSATLRIKTFIDSEVLPKVWAEHIENGERSKIRVSIYLKSTILGKEIKVKIADKEEIIETDLLSELKFEG